MEICTKKGNNMNVNIEIIDKPEIYTKATFKFLDLNTEKDYKETLAIVFMICADYYLDPELDLSDLKGFVEQGKENKKSGLCVEASEDGLELEFIDS